MRAFIMVDTTYPQSFEDERQLDISVSWLPRWFSETVSVDLHRNEKHFRALDTIERCLGPDWWAYDCAFHYGKLECLDLRTL